MSILYKLEDSADKFSLNNKETVPRTVSPAHNDMRGNLTIRTVSDDIISQESSFNNSNSNKNQSKVSYSLANTARRSESNSVENLGELTGNGEKVSGVSNNLSNERSKITLGMSDEQRYELLKDRKLSVPQCKTFANEEGLILTEQDISDLESDLKKVARPILKKLLKNLILQGFIITKISSLT